MNDPSFAVFRGILLIAAVGAVNSWLFDCTYTLRTCGSNAGAENSPSVNVNYSNNDTRTFTQNGNDLEKVSTMPNESDGITPTAETNSTATPSTAANKYIEMASQIQNVLEAMELVSKLTSSGMTSDDISETIATVFDSADILMSASDIDIESWVSFLDEAKIYLNAMKKTDIQKFLELSGKVLFNTQKKTNFTEMRNTVLIFEDYAVAATIPLLKSTNETEDVVVLNLESANVVACKSNSSRCRIDSEFAHFAVDRRDDLYVTFVEHTKALDEGTNKAFVLGSRVISVTAQNENKDTISIPVQFSLRHTEEPRSSEEKCVFMDNSSLQWSTTGCEIASTNQSHTRCSCNHTTNFAILFLHSDVQISEEDNFWFNVMTYVGCGVSITALIATMTIFIVLGLHRTERVVLLWHLCFCLCSAQLILVAGTTAKVGSPGCKLIAILLHFFFTASFSWMLMEGFHLYMKASNTRARHSFKVLITTGWVLPSVIVCAAVASGFNEYGSGTACWLSMENGLIWAFIGPAIGIIVINCIALIFVIKVFLGLKSISKSSERERIKKATKAVFFLMPLLGITWIFGLLAFDASTKWFLYLFCLCNSLQGLAIFILQCAKNDDVRKAFFKKYRRSFVSIGSYASGTSSSSNKTRDSYVNSEFPTKGLPTIAKW